MTLLTGTGFAQLIPVLASPILTRIYSPQEFGVFAFYFSLTSIINIASTGRLELAILIPKNESLSINVLKTSVLFSFFVSLSVFLILFVFKEELVGLLDNKIEVDLLFYIPFSIIIYGLYQNLNYWYNRKKKFKRISLNRIIQSTLIVIFQLLFGLSISSSSEFLIISSILGQLITLILFILSFIKDYNYSLLKIKKSEVKLVLKRYRNFPLIDVPTMLMNLAANHAPNIFFNLMSMSSIAGNYYFTQRILQLPVTLISGSVLDVFKEEASALFRERGNAKEVYLKTLKFLISITLIPSIILFFIVEDLFPFVFGQDWSYAGSFAKILIPALALRFIANPLSYMIYIAEKQRINFLLMLFLLIGVISTFYLVNDYYEIIQGLSLIYCLYYFFNLIISAKLAKIF